MSELLTVQGVHTAYDRIDVLHEVSLTVATGSITCILGANGAGKSTLIRSILGLTPAHTGTIYFDGRPISGLQTHRVIAAGIACIPEGRKVFPKMTVEENLRVGAALAAVDYVFEGGESIEPVVSLEAEHSRNLAALTEHVHARLARHPA